MLISGVPPEVIKVTGRWSSDSFFCYWCSLDELAHIHVQNLKPRRYRCNRYARRRSTSVGGQPMARHWLGGLRLWGLALLAFHQLFVRIRGNLFNHLFLTHFIQLAITSLLVLLWTQRTGISFPSSTGLMIKAYCPYASVPKANCLQVLCRLNSVLGISQILRRINTPMSHCGAWIHQTSR